MAHYNCMLIDLDNTLLDFDAAEASALAATLAHLSCRATRRPSRNTARSTKSSGGNSSAAASKKSGC